MWISNCSFWQLSLFTGFLISWNCLPTKTRKYKIHEFYFGCKHKNHESTNPRTCSFYLNHDHWYPSRKVLSPLLAYMKHVIRRRYFITWNCLPTKTTKIGTQRMKVISQNLFTGGQWLSPLTLWVRMLRNAFLVSHVIVIKSEWVIVA
jgi:hypothetical protein